MVAAPVGRSLVRVLIATSAATLSACSGGGGGGSGGASDAVLLTIGFSGGGVPLWQGPPSVPPSCPAQLLLNATVVFTFGGPVDPQSLPPLGPATGSINITRTAGSNFVPATGGFVVADDPSLPAGNARRVLFLPAASANPAAPAAGGFESAATYSVFVPRGGPGVAAVVVSGAPLTTEALTCFTTCDAATAPSCLGEPFPGPPFVAATTPATGDPGPAPVSPVAITGNTVSILTSEPLFPANIGLQTVRLVNIANGAQAPGSVVFHQAGSPEAGPQGSRIDYVASGPLLDSTTYELFLDAAITDFSGYSIVPWEPGASGAPASGRRLFTTVALPSCAQPPIVEDFGSTANLGSVSGAVTWPGGGALLSGLPPELLGNGAFGPLGFGAGPSTLDTGQPQIVLGGQIAFERGNWNATDFLVGAGATVRCIGPFRVHVRCRGTATVLGALNGSAGTNPNALIGDPEQGPKPGNFNNGTPANPTWVAGGVGNAGAGGGGRASQADVVGVAQRTPRGEDGFGPTLDGQLNPGPAGSNPHYGGGQGGQGGFFFPQGGQTGEVGGLGAAGGSAFFTGGNGGPNSALPVPCVPGPTTVQTRALATGAPPAFATPVLAATAGSGGGGGGDRFEPAGVANDDQGGGGGGGGGGLRITSFGDLSLDPGSNLSMNGATGAQGNVFQGGHGGGGSGGEIWLQSFAQIAISTQATLMVSGGAAANACGNQASGDGSAGLIQIEDRDGLVNTAFLGTAPGSSNIVALAFPLATQLSGAAVSAFFDSGYGNPIWTSAVETFDLGTAAGGAVGITYQGAHEALTGGMADPATLTAPVPAAQIGQLSGHRYVRFSAVLSLPLPNPPVITGTTPSVDEIRLLFSAPIQCP